MLPALKAFVFNRTGHCEPASDARLFDYGDLNRCHVRKLLHGPAAAVNAGPEFTVVFAARAPWAQPTVLARCGMVMAAGGAIEIYAPSQDAVDEFSATISGIGWWAERLGDPDRAASASAAVLCSTILSRPDLDRTDPTVSITLIAIAEVLVAVGTRASA